MIVFDAMGFVRRLTKIAAELDLGSRQNIYLKKFEQFLIDLQNASASLAFFCDGQLQSNKNDEWCRRCRDFEYKISQAMILNQVKI